MHGYNYYINTVETKSLSLHWTHGKVKSHSGTMFKLICVIHLTRPLLNLGGPFWTFHTQATLQGCSTHKSGKLTKVGNSSDSALFTQIIWFKGTLYAEENVCWEERKDSYHVFFMLWDCINTIILAPEGKKGCERPSSLPLAQRYDQLDLNYSQMMFI